MYVVIMELADEMAASAAAFNSHQNYTIFIQSRDRLKQTLEKVFTNTTESAIFIK